MKCWQNRKLEWNINLSIKQLTEDRRPEKLLENFTLENLKVICDKVLIKKEKTKSDIGKF